MKVLEHVPDAAGLDEAGRGPLAGPVVAAAVILPKDFDVRGLNDSKVLDLAQREAQESRIKASAIWAICFVEPAEIDRLNILWASMAAMERAYADLTLAPTQAFIDGNRVPNSMLGFGQAVIKGDAKLACIAAASILAKTARDRFMKSMDGPYPGYGFGQNFGYPTPDHLDALRRLGPCDIHRRSFGPVALFGLGTLDL